jgi:hypothetical protein
MVLKLFVGLIVIVAIIVGMLTLTTPKEYLVRLIIFRDFFDVSLPILAFGALVKYLCTCHKCHCHREGQM